MFSQVQRLPWPSYAMQGAAQAGLAEAVVVRKSRRSCGCSTWLGC